MKFYSLFFGGNLQGVIEWLRGEEVDTILLNAEKKIKNKAKFYWPINLFSLQQGVLNFLLFGVQGTAVMKKSIEQTTQKTQVLPLGGRETVLRFMS